MGQFIQALSKRLYLPDLPDFGKGFTVARIILSIARFNCWSGFGELAGSFPPPFPSCRRTARVYPLRSAGGPYYPGAGELEECFSRESGGGACAYLPWCHLPGGLVLIYFLNSYIYMGPSPLWNYLHNITRKALAPLYLLPLQISKIDFTPVAAMAIIFLIYENGIRLLSALFTLAMR